MILVRNDNGYERFFFGHDVLYPVQARILTHFHPGIYSDTVKMRLNRPLPGFERIALAGRILRSRTPVCPPVVQRPWNVADLLCLFHTAQRKIIILRSVKLRPHRPDLIKKRPADRRQMADIIHTAQQIHIEIRLKVRF